MTLSAGSRLGPYEILAPLGAGGMGEVYRARDKRLDRDVAIKVLPAELADDPDRLRRFEQEAKAVAALNHPNLLAVFDFGQHEGIAYVVFELLDGETLRERLAEGPASRPQGGGLRRPDRARPGRGPREGDRASRPEAREPVRDEGRAREDPGLRPGQVARPARRATRARARTVSTATEPGMVLGTVGYMSPEQVRGEPADHRSDLFAFGSVLFEMLSGSRGLRGGHRRRDHDGDPERRPAGARASGSRPGSSAIVRRCLEKRPEERFQSARDSPSPWRASLSTRIGVSQKAQARSRRGRVRAAGWGSPPRGAPPRRWNRRGVALGARDRRRRPPRRRPCASSSSPTPRAKSSSHAALAGRRDASVRQAAPPETSTSTRSASGAATRST